MKLHTFFARLGVNRRATGGTRGRESERPTRQVQRTSLGILKRCPTMEEAEREAQALRLARQVLYPTVRVPRLIRQHGDRLLQEDVGSRNCESLEDSITAARYLADIHNSRVDTVVRGRLIAGNHAQYWQPQLAERISLEGAYARRAFGSGSRGQRKIVREFCEFSERVRDYQLPRHSEVIVHGDYQPQNLCFVSSGEVCAVDWIDFGLGNRWYEIAHFLFKLPESHHGPVVAAYQNASLVRFRDWDTSLAYGASVDCVIRAGSQARLSTRSEPRFARFQTLFQGRRAAVWQDVESTLATATTETNT